MNEIDTYETPPVPAYDHLVVRSVTLASEAISFVGIFLRERPWFLLPAAAPAMAAIICTVAIFLWCIVQQNDRITARLKTHLAEAVMNDDLARRKICVWAMLQHSPEDPACQFAYALLLRDDGKLEASQELLDQLAPAVGSGFGPAHRLLAEELLLQLQADDTEPERQARLLAAIHHMESAGVTGDPPWDYQLGKLYAEAGELVLAELRIRQAARAGYGAAQMVASRIERSQGNPAAADELVKAAQATIESYVLEHPNDQDARLAWIECLLERKDWPTLLRAFRRISEVSGTDDYRNRLGQLYLRTSRCLPGDTTATREAMVYFAIQAFRLLKDPIPAAWRLVELTRVRFPVDRAYLEELVAWHNRGLVARPTDANWLQLGACMAEAVGDIEAARVGFCEAAKIEPRAISELASFYRRQGRLDELRITNGQVIERFQQLLAENPQDAVAGIILATSYADQQRWQDAREILRSFPDNEQALSNLAVLCVREYDLLSAATPPSITTPVGDPAGEDEPSQNTAIQRCELLCQALFAIPEFPPAMKRLQDELQAESARKDDAIQGYLLRTLAAGKVPVAIHHLLGLRAISEDAWWAAVRHFEQLNRLRPSDPFILNNLAYALLRAQSSDAAMHRARKLIQEALELLPQHPELLATRGEILARLGDDAGAAADLESALQGLPERRPELHSVLAECYRRLGIEALYRVHQQAAETARETP